MIVLVVLVVVTAIFGSQSHPISYEDKEKLFKDHTECVDDTGVDENLIDDYDLGHISEESAFKEYTFCVNRKLGFQNEAGEFQREFVRNKLSKYFNNSAEIERLIEDCMVEKDSPVESAYNSFKCYRQSPNYIGMFYIIIFSKENFKKIKKVRAQCIAETGAEIVMIDNVRETGEFPDDPLFKKYIFCLSKKLGFQSEDGTIQGDIIKGNLTKYIKSSARAEKLYEACVVEKDTPENTALSMMKCFYAKSHLNIIYAFSLPSEKAEKLWTYRKECLAATAVDKSLVDAARKGVFSEDPQFKEYLYCLSKKIGFQNEDGDIQLDAFRQKINDIIGDPDESRRLIEKCVVKKDSPQETAYSTVKCYYENTSYHLSVLKAIACIEERTQKLTKYNNECTTESGISSEMLEQVRKGIFTDDEKFKNHLFCFYKKLRIQNESGEIQARVLSKKFGKLIRDPELSEKLVEKCAITKGSPQDTAYGAFTCYYENTPTHFNIFTRF